MRKGGAKKSIFFSSSSSLVLWTGVVWFTCSTILLKTRPELCEASVLRTGGEYLNRIELQKHNHIFKKEGLLAVVIVLSCAPQDSNPAQQIINDGGAINSRENSNF